MADRPDRWIGVGLARQIKPGSSNPAIVGGNAIAVWRAEKGPANVWEDRCPHRGMRLSFGFVRDGMLRCIYHGWGYEPGGRCASIPAHPDLAPPKTICANVYPSNERYGIIWTNLSETPNAPLPDAGAEEGWQSIRSVHVKQPVAAVKDGLARFDWDGGRIEQIDDGVAFVNSDARGLSLLIAIQPVDESRTGLHVVAKGNGAKDAKARLTWAARLERLRDAIEAQS